VSAPAVVIRIAIEAPLAVRVEAMNEQEVLRLEDWLRVHPLLVAFIEAAIELGEERAA
jgi:hypothetical protein